MINKKIIYSVIFIFITAIIFAGCIAYTDKDRKNPLDPGSADYIVQIKTNYTTFAIDNFDYPNGQLPPFGNWLFVGPQPFCAIGTFNGITDNAVRFWGGAAGGENSAIIQNKPISGHFIVEFYMRNPSALTGEYRSSFRLIDGSGVIIYLEVGTDTASSFFYNATTSGGGMASSGIYTMNIWYYIKMEVDLSPGNKKFSCWYKPKDAPGDPILIGSGNISIPTIPDSIPRFEFRIFNTFMTPTQETHIDNFKITKIEITK